MKISLRAYSKINPALKVKRRLENGYHEVDMIMQSVSLFDEIELEDTENKGEVHIKSSDSLIDTSDNTAKMAVKYFDEYYPLDMGVKISITKNIPIAAGMAGGSADAAGVLTALNILNNNPLTERELCRIAEKIGADVPFMLSGGTVRVGGIGERLTPISDFPECFLILIKNADKLSTGYMYNKLDTIQRQQNVDVDALSVAIENRDFFKIAKYIGNDFADAWGGEVHSVIDRLKGEGAISASITGSGPTVFGIFIDKQTAENVFARLKREYKEIYLVTPVKKSIEILNN